MAGDVRLVIDIETTGFSPAHAQVIEIGLVLLVGDRVQGPHGMLVRPTRTRALWSPAARRAAAVHRIAPREVLRHGMSLPQAALRVHAFVERVTERHGAPELWAHGASFEARFLESAPWSLSPWNCTMAKARGLYDLPSYKLGALAEHLGIPLPRAHRAPDDALATAKLLLAMEAD